MAVIFRLQLRFVNCHSRRVDIGSDRRHGVEVQKVLNIENDQLVIEINLNSNAYLVCTGTSHIESGDGPSALFNKRHFILRRSIRI
jgi:hypothetical protein